MPAAAWYARFPERRVWAQVVEGAEDDVAPAPLEAPAGIFVFLLELLVLELRPGDERRIAGIERDPGPVTRPDRRGGDFVAHLPRELLPSDRRPHDLLRLIDPVAAQKRRRLRSESQRLRVRRAHLCRPVHRLFGAPILERHNPLFGVGIQFQKVEDRAHLGVLVAKDHFARLAVGEHMVAALEVIANADDARRLAMGLAPVLAAVAGGVERDRLVRGFAGDEERRLLTVPRCIERPRERERVAGAP